MRRSRLIPAVLLVCCLVAVGVVVWLESGSSEDGSGEIARTVPAPGEATPARVEALENGPRESAVRTDDPDEAATVGPTLQGHPESVWLAIERAATPVRGPSGRRTPITGLVWDGETKEGLCGVRVTFRGALGTAEAETDENGVYRLLLPGVWWHEAVRFTKAGYIPRTLAIPPGRAQPNGQVPPIALRRIARHLPGIVYDWQGSPKAGVHVSVGDREAPFVSDARGRFGPVPVVDGYLSWLAWGADCARTEDRWQVTSTGPDRLVVRLVPHGFIEGTVVDERGRPVGSAKVLDSRHPDALRLRTSAGGTFRWPQPLQRSARLVAVKGERNGSAQALADLPARIVITPAGRGTWRGRFGPRYGPRAPPPREASTWPAITFRILAVDARGRPLPWARVERRRQKHCTLEDRWTGPDGRCVLRGRSVSPIVLDATHFRGGRCTHTVAFEGDCTRTLRLVLERPPPPSKDREVEATEEPKTWIEGTLLDAKGRPFPDVWLEAWPWGSDCTGEHGRFRIAGGVPGEAIRLRVDADRFAPFSAEVIAGAPDNVVRLPARSTLAIALEGTPLPGAAPRVKVWATPRLEHEVLPYDDPPNVQHEGREVRVHVPVGTCTVAFCMGPGTWQLYPGVKVVAGRPTKLVYGFPELADLTGRVRTIAGKPVDGADVVIAATGGIVADSDEEGRITRTDESDPIAPAGAHRLRVDAWGFAPLWTKAIDLTRDVKLDLTLRPGVEVEGRVIDARGMARYAEVAWLVDEGPALYACDCRRNGTFGLNGCLPPGRARLRVRIADRPDHIETVTIPAGRETVNVRIVLP